MTKTNPEINQATLEKLFLDDEARPLVMDLLKHMGQLYALTVQDEEYQVYKEFKGKSPRV